MELIFLISLLLGEYSPEVTKYCTERLRANQKLAHTQWYIVKRTKEECERRFGDDLGYIGDDVNNGNRER